LIVTPFTFKPTSLAKSLLVKTFSDSFLKKLPIMMVMGIKGMTIKNNLRITLNILQFNF